MLQEIKNDNKKMYRSNLTRVIWETILTSIGAGFSVSTITIFWNSIGMDQTAIGFVQMMFTIVIFALDIPMGYIADRFNRKILNVVGDIGVAVTFVVYAFSSNMYMVILSECLLGVFMAMTNGVDQSFIKYNCNQIDSSGELFKKTNIKVQTLRYISLLIVVIIGGFMSKYSLRLAIGCSFIPYFIGGLIALGIKDFNGKVESKHKNPIKDIAHNVKDIMKEKSVRAYLFSYILGNEVTHSQIWIFTPLLVLIGVPIEIVSLGWVLNYVMQILGSILAKKLIKLKVSNRFAIPMIIEMIWMTIIVLNTNIITIWLFGLNGMVHGLMRAILITPLQESTKDEVQTSVMSIASTGGRLLYMPIVYIINYLGNIKLQLALVGVIALFLPMSLYVYIGLRHIEKRHEVKTITDGSEQ